ncbi:MAG: ankyrin repeat domain-containing protein [Planctomycetota bacterium]
MTRSILLFALAISYSSVCVAQTPHRLLWDGTPGEGKTALKIMMKDPSWVTKRDSDSRTPLHVAARFNHIDVVKWLLKNGADVDAQAYNRFTPLHLTKNPEIVKLILEKNPDLTLKSVSGTALQGAIDDLRHYTNISNRGESVKQGANALRKIVALYVEHLGDDIDLVSAVRLGRLDTVRKIVANDPAAAHGEKYGPNPLREAANWGRIEICKFLVEEHKVDVDDFDGGTGYPIMKAALKYPEIVKYLIENGADLKTRITWKGGRTGVWIIGDDATALHFAARDGVPETVKILLDAGVDPFATAHDSFDEGKKQTALEVAAYFGKTDNALSILDHPTFKNADPKLRKQSLNESLRVGSSSSWLAFEAQDRSELLDALLMNGADLDSGDAGSPIQIAVSSIHPNDDDKNESIKKMVTVLRKHGAEIDVFSAVAIGDFESLAKLLGEDPKSSNSYSIGGYPALHMAIKMNYPKAVKLLLDAKCDIEIKNKSESTGLEGGTPLLCVAFWGHDEIAKMLVAAGGNVNATAEKNVSPLHEAVRFGNVGIARLLLENGANKQAADHEGKSPLEWASNETSQQKFAQLFSEFDESRDKH